MIMEEYIENFHHICVPKVEKIGHLLFQFKKILQKDLSFV